MKFKSLHFKNGRDSFDGSESRVGEIHFGGIWCSGLY